MVTPANEDGWANVEVRLSFMAVDLPSKGGGV